MDLKSQFHQQTWDNVHFYLTHLFELGMRQKQKDIQQEQEYKEEKKGDFDNNMDDEWNCFDKQFKKQSTLIQSKRKKFPRFSGRFQPTSNKFTITTMSNEQKNDSIVEGTFLDALEKRLHNDENISDEQVRGFKEYVDAEEFDSDAVMEDIGDLSFDDSSANSNLLQAIKDNQLWTLIHDFTKQIKFKGSAFSTGFCFFYWKHFGAKDEERRVQHEQNRNDYDGFTQFDLYIEAGKYSNLKDEILSNNDNEVGIDEYDAIIIKVKEYMGTQRVKRIECRFDKLSYDDVINFEIENGASISGPHIASLLFYTDFSELCTSFSKTFRRLEAGESLHDVKQRNMCYWWMSKFIIEAVNCFGSNGYTKRGGEAGPFFCGLGTVIQVPSFRIRLNSPTSTSKSMLVGQNFAKDHGMILELNNQIDRWVKKLKFFNVSFMSKFAEENERLFVHGQWSIEILSIRLTANWKNFGSFLAPLSQFDAAISGGDDEAVIGFSEKDGKIICLLFEENKRIPMYIQDTWRMFCYYKKTLNINLDYLTNNYPSVLQDLIVGWSYKEGCDGNKISSKFKDMHEGKLLKSKLINLFPNLTDIVIECTDSAGWHSYRVSLCGLLDILSEKRNTNKIKCSLYGVWKDKQEWDGNRRSWLYYEYTSISSSLNAKYNTIKIQLKQIVDNFGDRKDLLSFECM